MKKNTFIEGTVIATLAIIFTKIIGMLYVIPFYSIIGPHGSTLYSYAYNIYQIFLSISSAGIPIAMSKLISEFDSKEMKEAKVRSFKLGILIVSLLSIVCFIFLMFFSENVALWIVGDKIGGTSIEEITMVIFVISFAILIIPFLSVGRGFLQGHNYIKPASVSQMIEQLVRIFVILIGSFVSIKILNKSVSFGVSVAVSGAFWGGLVAIFYIFKKIKDHKKELNLDKRLERNDISNKEILKKIFGYAIPFVIINVTVNIYNTVDMSLIIRTLSKIGFTGVDAEFVASAVTTWGYKLNAIVTAVATGLTVSLIPNVVRTFNQKNYKELNSIINKSLKIVLFVSLPAALGLSFLSESVWNVFYGVSSLGPVVFKMSILTSILCNVYLICIQTGQSLNRYKTVYLAVFVGFISNALLDAPLMFLCNKIGLPAFWGASIATMTGYILSIIIVMKDIKKIEGISYKSAFRTFLRLLFAVSIMLLGLCLLRIILPINNSTKFASLLYIIIYAVVGATIYLFITYKLNIINNLFGEKIISKVLNIITFGKYKSKGEADEFKNN